MTGSDVELAELGPMDPIADGGQGVVYRLAHRPGTLAKLYRPGIGVGVAELRVLINWPARLPPTDRSVIADRTAWPRQRVFARGRCVGFLMDEAPARFGTTLAGRPRLLELQYLLYPPRAMWCRLRLPGAADRRRLAVQYLGLFGLLQDNGVIAGDVSMRNLLWTLAGGPAVFAIDCDGFRIDGHECVVRQAATPGWADPAAPSGPPTLDSDRYKVALLVLRLLLADRSVTPESVSGSPELRAELGPELSTLAEFAAIPGARPGVDRWLSVMDDLVDISGPLEADGVNRLPRCRF